MSLSTDESTTETGTGTASALSIADVIGMLADNLRLRGSVVPLSRRASTGWARGLNLPHGGRQVLYTGQMFQLMPYLETLSTARAKIADSPLARMSGLGRKVNRYINVTTFLGVPSRQAREEYDHVLSDVVAVLRGAGIEPGYLYEDDLYTGALVHDYGEDEVVALQGRRILANLRKHGVEEVITIDPHTTTMMRSVLPGLVEGFDVTVRSYLEVLVEAEAPVRNTVDATVTVHDSCLFARAENVIDEPRALLRSAGVTVRETVNSGASTWCCGGPAESLYPERAAANARVRAGELGKAAGEAVTMCPICLVNLRKAAGEDVRLNDISGYLRRAYGD